MVFFFDVDTPARISHNTNKELTVSLTFLSHQPVWGDMIGLYSAEKMHDGSITFPSAYVAVDADSKDKGAIATFSRKFAFVVILS